MTSPEHDIQKIQRAETLIELSRPREALALLLQVYANSPDDFRTVAWISACYYYLGEHEKALEFAEKACAISPENEWSHRLRALSLKALGRKKESIAAAAEAVRISPQEINALLTLAAVYHQWNYFRELGDVSQTMLKLAPGNSDVHNYAGISHLNTGNLTRAEEHFREALRLDPLSPEARNNLGLLELRRNEGSAEAIAHFEAAIRLDPTGEYALDNIRVARGAAGYLVTALALTPLLAAAVFVLPGLGLLALLGCLLYGISALINSAGSMSGLSKEVRTMLKAGGYRRRIQNSFRSAAKTVMFAFRPLLPVYIPAFIAVVLKVFALLLGSDGLSYGAYLALLVAGVILYLIGITNKFDSIQRKNS